MLVLQSINSLTLNASADAGAGDAPSSAVLGSGSASTAQRIRENIFIELMTSDRKLRASREHNEARLARFHGGA